MRFRAWAERKLRHPGTIPPAHYGSQTDPPERSERGFPHEAPMLILLALILASVRIAWQSAGLRWVWA